MQEHLLSLTSPPSVLENTNESSFIGSIQPCIILRNIGSSIAIRIPSLKQYGIISSTHLTDEKFDDIQQILNKFKPGEKFP